MQYNHEGLENILTAHIKWLETSGKEGTRADLQGADLQGADLQGADLQGAALQGADLQGAALQGADLQGADLRSADLGGAHLQGANLQDADLVLSTLHFADLENANLTKASLENSNLRGAKLQRAILHEANLTRANLTDADLFAADIWSADLQGAIYDNTQLAVAKNVDEKWLLPANTLEQTTENLQIELTKAQTAIEKLKENLAKATTETEKANLEKELAQKIQAEQNIQQQFAQQNSLEQAIAKISAAIQDDKQLIETYKKQSNRLLWAGITCFGIGISYTLFKAFSPNLIALTKTPITEIIQFTPGFLAFALGTVMFRHDWKVRQLMLSLIQQNNKIDIATGLLTASLNLSRQEMPKLLHQTFKEVRTQLLFGNNPKTNEESNDNEDLLPQTLASTAKAAVEKTLKL